MDLRYLMLVKHFVALNQMRFKLTLSSRDALYLVRLFMSIFFILMVLSVDAQVKENTATIPVPQLEKGFYDWWFRHEEVLRVKDSINPEIVLIGNSITHLWGGLPKAILNDGRARKPNGPEAWKSAFRDFRVLNLGFGWDRTQNVLWRLANGEMDGLSPRYVIVHIGTNNTSETVNARMNTAPEIAAGVMEICNQVSLIAPDAKIILMAIMPRQEHPDHPRRQLINETNEILKNEVKKNGIMWVDIGSKMLGVDGVLSRDIAKDFCHPTEKGYQIWADAIRPLLK